MIRWIIANVPPGRFNRLAVRDSQLGGSAACELAEWPGLANLEELDLRGNNLGDLEALALAESAHVENLSRWHLSRNGFTQKGQGLVEEAVGAGSARVADWEMKKAERVPRSPSGCG